MVKVENITYAYSRTAGNVLERIGFELERLQEAGARDVYTIPIQMKKTRPGTLIRVMCLEREKESMAALLFKHAEAPDLLFAQKENQ